MSSVAVEFWVWGAATLLLTAALGFGAGIVYARHTSRRSLQRAAREFSRLFAAVLQTLDAAHEACGVLERFPLLRLSDAQLSELDRRRRSLEEVLSRTVAAGQGIPANEPERARPLQDDFQVEWSRGTEDALTQTPDREAFDANLTALLEAGKRSGIASGLLVCKVDRLDQLKARFGAAGARQFLQKMAAVLVRAVRDEDLVCRFAEDVFGVLAPAVGPDAGTAWAQTVRNAVRHSRFRLDGDGPEVLVTASFGYTPCLPDDGPDLVLDRALDALTRSQHRGRNQLYHHNGSTLTHLAAHT